MVAKTHRIAGSVIAMGSYMYFRSKGMVGQELNSEVIEFLAFYASAYYGSVFPDIDHHGDSNPCKDPLSMMINRTLHLTSSRRKKGKKNGILGIFDARHRSWQTHSELPLILIIIALSFMQMGFGYMMLFGFGVGVFAHILMDLQTSGGVPVFLFMLVNKILGKKILPEKIRLVPRWKFFKTDEKFEEWVYIFMSFVSVGLAFWLVFGSFIQEFLKEI